MAVKVIITTVSPDKEPDTGQTVDGSISITLAGDYQSPVPMPYVGLTASFHDKRSRNAGIRRALKKVEELGNQIAEGARKAMDDHPIGG